MVDESTVDPNKRLLDIDMMMEFVMLVHRIIELNAKM